jgi:branched-chain amino acid transport system permease protein
MTERGSVRDSLAAASAWRWWEFALGLVALGSCVFAGEHALLLNEIAILGLFAMSLDLVLGYAGIVSLGHAAFFGFGAYAAALFAKHVMPDPLVGLAVATAASALLGAFSSLLILRGSDLTRLMVTLGVASVLYELANKLDGLTGGTDGLQGVVMGPLLGRFEFDLYGRTAYAYSLAVLVLALLLARRVVHSPFGISLKALRDNRLRATSVGLSVNARLAAVYTLAAGLAQIALTKLFGDHACFHDRKIEEVAGQNQKPSLRLQRRVIGRDNLAIRARAPGDVLGHAAASDGQN